MSMLVNPFAGFGSAGSWKVPVTIPSGTVDSDLVSFPIFVSLSDMPIGFWNHVRPDGGDIRVKKSDGTLVPTDLVWFNYSTHDGVLFFKASLIDADADCVWEIHYGKAADELLPFDDTYGRNEVWSDYDVVIIPGDDIYNRTGKSASHAWGNPQTFELISSSPVTGHEGVMPLPDGTFVVIGSNALRRYDATLTTVLASNLDPAGDAVPGGDSCGGGCYFDGKLYVTTGFPTQISIYDPYDLTFVETFDISATGDGIGGLEVCPVDGHIYGIPYVTTGLGTTDMIRYNRTTGVYIDTITMSSPIKAVNGIIWNRDSFLVPDLDTDRYNRVELDGTVTVGGLFGGGVVEDGGVKDGDIFVVRVISGESSVVDRWSAFRSALGGGGAEFVVNGRITAPVSVPGTTFSIGVSLAHSSASNVVALALATATAAIANVAYTGSTIRPFYDSSNLDFDYASAKDPGANVMARVNVAYEGTTRRRAYYNGGDEIIDNGISAIGSTVAQFVYGSTRYDIQAFSWRGMVGWGYLRMSALSDDWIAAEYLNVGAPGSFYDIGSELVAINIAGTPVISAVLGTAYGGFTVSAVGGVAPIVFSVHAGSLPGGLSLNTGTGVVSGSPTAEETQSGIVIRATDVNGAFADLTPFAITVTQTTIAGTPVTPATVNSVYAGFTVSASGGTGPYVFTVHSGTLPSGLALNSSSGLVSGTPTVIETQTGIVIRATDANGIYDDLGPFAITIAPAGFDFSSGFSIGFS